MGGTDPLGVFDDPRYAARALELATTYQAAAPFPHVVIDDFLPEPLAEEVSAAFPPRDSIEWVERDNVNNRRRFQHDETKLPVLLRSMLRELNGRQFVLFLETLTGFDNLIPDPYLMGGGVHVSERGDFLNVHADFNWHHKLQAHRRCNVLLYLSERWEDDWGGFTELWSPDMATCEVRIKPVFNRMLVFNTSETSNHGAPEPNACPEGTMRKVLNLYYYTTRRDDEDADALPHFTAYRTEASPTSMELGAEYRESASRAQDLT